MTRAIQSIVSKGALVMVMAIGRRSVTRRGGLGGQWAVVSFDGMPVIDQLADSAPGWTSACAGVGNVRIQAAFDDFLVTSP